MSVIKRLCSHIFLAIALAGHPAHSAPKEFPIFNATAFIDPEGAMPAAGLIKLPIVFEPQMDPDWAKASDRSGLPRESSVKRAVTLLTSGHKLACINLEVWPLASDSSPQDLNETLIKLRTVARWAHQASPDLMIGYYGILPVNSYWGAVRPESPEGKWRELANKSLATLAEDIDIVYPSLYTFYDDPEQWQQYALAQIAQARKLGKPVYVFLWPQYHGSNKTLGLTEIPRDYWRKQLDVAYEHADGIVIWGGWDWKKNKPAWFKPEADWWRETLAFMQTISSQDTKAPPSAPDTLTVPETTRR